MIATIGYRINDHVLLWPRFPLLSLIGLDMMPLVVSVIGLPFLLLVMVVGSSVGTLQLAETDSLQGFMLPLLNPD